MVLHKLWIVVPENFDATKILEIIISKNNIYKTMKLHC